MNFTTLKLVCGLLLAACLISQCCQTDSLADSPVVTPPTQGDVESYIESQPNSDELLANVKRLQEQAESIEENQGKIEKDQAKLFALGKEIAKLGASTVVKPPMDDVQPDTEPAQPDQSEEVYYETAPPLPPSGGGSSGGSNGGNIVSVSYGPWRTTSSGRVSYGSTGSSVSNWRPSWQQTSTRRNTRSWSAPQRTVSRTRSWSAPTVRPAVSRSVSYTNIALANVEASNPMATFPGSTNASRSAYRRGPLGLFDWGTKSQTQTYCGPNGCR